jgi:hypothetical protein
LRCKIRMPGSMGVTGVMFAVLSVWLCGVTPVAAVAQNTIVLDDFENGIGAWTRNDKVKSQNPASDVTLVDIVATKPGAGGLPGSKGAALFTFKEGKDSWASTSLKVKGANWADMGAQRLTFWLNADGEPQGTELVLRTPTEAFYIPVRLNVKNWRRVSIPLEDIKNDKGPLLSRLNAVYLVQFVQRGSWDSRFFVVDQLQVEGNGEPLVPPADSGTAPATTTDTDTATATSAPIPANATTVEVDFLRRQGRVRSAANVTAGAGVPSATGTVTYPLSSNAQFRKALATLGPRMIRLDSSGLVDLVDSLRPTFDFSRLVTSVEQARAIKAEPLIALANDPTWGLDDRGYALFAAQAASAVNARRGRPVRYFELALDPAASDNATTVGFYNRAYAALKGQSRDYYVGGIGASSGRTGTIVTLLRGAQGLDFLSVQYFGSVVGQPGTPALFNSARGLASLRTVATALDKSKWRNAPIYITQSNLNGMRDYSTNLPGDSRLVRMVSAAWWATFLSNASHLADQVFHNDAVNPEWGLLDEGSRAYPAYYTLWMWNTFIPSGSERVQTVSSRSDVAAMAVNTATAHNVLIANTTEKDVTVRVGIRGFPVLRAARIRLLEDPQRGVQFEELPKSPFQTVRLRPYAVAVLQFIEPPKTRTTGRTR